MVNFENISLKQITTLFELLAQNSLFKKSFVKKQYLRSARHFEETTDFLAGLNFITNSNDEIKIQKENVQISETQLNNREKLRELLIKKLIYQENCFTDYITEFLHLFHFENGKYVSLQNMDKRLKYSGLRNLLIDLGFLYADGGTYVVKDGYVLGANSTWKLPEKAFRQILEIKEELGAFAELEVIKYEKKRLSEYPALAENIEHVAKKDVTAGFDIKSFELGFEDKPRARLIEVKAVSLVNHKFFWSRNEIEKARTNVSQYYLYLLPVISRKKFDVDSMKIIKNPIKEIYHSQHNWHRTEELLSFSLKRESL